MNPAFIILPIIYTCANAYLYFASLQAVACLPTWSKVLFSIIFWIAAFALFIAIGLRKSRLPNLVVGTLFRIGSVWIVFLLYSVLLLAVADIIHLALPFPYHSLWYVLPLVGVLLIYGYINYRNPRIERINITIEKETTPKMRIVAISDIHLGYGTGIKAFNKYIDLINAQRPDIVLIMGDLIDNSLKPIVNKPYAEAIAKIHTPLGIYMAPGNHEYLSGIDNVVKYISDTPVTLLRDCIVELPNGIQIAGRDDCTNSKRESLETLMARTDKKRPIIVLDHQPRKLAKADALKVDLLLCGHTHRGQVFPFNLITDRIYEQSHGYRKWSHAHILVSSGLSIWGPPFRIGTHSDLAVINIQ